MPVVWMRDHTTNAASTQPGRAKAHSSLEERVAAHVAGSQVCSTQLAGAKIWFLSNIAASLSCNDILILVRTKGLCIQLEECLDLGRGLRRTNAEIGR